MPARSKQAYQRKRKCNKMSDTEDESSPEKSLNVTEDETINEGQREEGISPPTTVRMWDAVRQRIDRLGIKDLLVLDTFLHQKKSNGEDFFYDVDQARLMKPGEMADHIQKHARSQDFIDEVEKVRKERKLAILPAWAWVKDAGLDHREAREANKQEKARLKKRRIDPEPALHFYVFVLDFRDQEYRKNAKAWTFNPDKVANRRLIPNLYKQLRKQKGKHAKLNLPSVPIGINGKGMEGCNECVAECCRFVSVIADRGLRNADAVVDYLNEVSQ